MDKTRAYLERSKSSPIKVSLKRVQDLAPQDPFLQIIPHAIGRLESLSIRASLINLQDITSRLSLPAPLLKHLSIDGSCGSSPQFCPVLTPALFGGNFSSLRTLSLGSTRTELPWRDMTNLTSFTLAHIPPNTVSVKHLLDFFETTPHLREVRLRRATPTSGDPNGRLMSLAYLKRMEIIGVEPSSLLLDHLLIPIGAKLTTQVDSSGCTKYHLPRSLDNLRNLSNFTKLLLYTALWPPRVQFSGPNGQVTMVPFIQLDATDVVFEYLTQFDTSKVERLEIDCDLFLTKDLHHRTLLPMKGLRTLTLSRCQSSHGFITALCPGTSSSEVVVCPELEELILVSCVNREALDMKDVVEMAVARASRGAKLKSVRIVGDDKVTETEAFALELKEYVSRVEFGSDVGGIGDDSDDEG